MEATRRSSSAVFMTTGSQPSRRVSSESSAAPVTVNRCAFFGLAP